MLGGLGTEIYSNPGPNDNFAKNWDALRVEMQDAGARRKFISLKIIGSRFECKFLEKAGRVCGKRLEPFIGDAWVWALTIYLTDGLSTRQITAADRG